MRECGESSYAVAAAIRKRPASCLVMRPDGGEGDRGHFTFGTARVIMQVPLQSFRMKRSSAIHLGFLHGLVLGAAGCSPDAPAPDPCDPALYDDRSCERAVATSGYWYLGTWVPRTYPQSALYYAGEHDRYVVRGGTTVGLPSRVYAPDYLPPADRAAAVMERATPAGTRLSAQRMTALATRGTSLASGRRGATVSRGGFGAIGAGRAFRGG
jgi:hypothetical protein